MPGSGSDVYRTGLFSRGVCTCPSCLALAGGDEDDDDEEDYVYRPPLPTGSASGDSHVSRPASETSGCVSGAVGGDESAPC